MTVVDATIVKENHLEYQHMDLEDQTHHWWSAGSLPHVGNSNPGGWRSKVCPILAVATPFFLIALIMAALKFHQQDLMLRDLEAKADNMVSSISSLPSKLQQTGEVEEDKMDGVLSEMEKLGNSLTAELTRIHEAVKDKSKMAALEHLVTNLTSTISSISTRQHHTVEKERSKMAAVEHLVSNLTSTISSISAKLHGTDENLRIMLSNFTSEWMDIKQSKGTPQYVCRDNWNLNAASCYLFSTDKRSWYEARAYCRAQGGGRFWSSNKKPNGNSIPEQYWLGLTDEVTDTWSWVDGTPYIMDQSNWEEGQPDNWVHHGRGGGEDCAEINKLGKLNDAHCTALTKYICKKTALTS